MPMVARNIMLGSVAGMLAVLVFHQGMYYLLATSGVVGGGPWRLVPAPFWRDLSIAFRAPVATVPLLIGLVIWGGLWGGLFGLFADWMPGRLNWLKGMIFALLFPLLLGSWLIIPLIRGTTTFSGFFPTTIQSGSLTVFCYSVHSGSDLGLFTRSSAGFWIAQEFTQLWT